MFTSTSGLRSHPRQPIAALTALVVALGWLMTGAPQALADGPSTFINSSTISIPATGSANQRGPAAPYPSTIAVSGLSGLVSNVTVTFTGLSHGSAGDIDAMVVAPSGENIVIVSDVGDPGGEFPGAQLVTANNIDLTFSDAAVGPVPRMLTLVTGTYKPTNTGGVDTFPAPAPAPSSKTTLAGSFTGIEPNGAWMLYAVDDVSGEVGSIAGGWSLTITTETAARATVTSVTTSDATSTTGDPVTFTATVTAGGTPVTTGGVQFRDGDTALGGPVALDGVGHASLTTSALSEGTHEIRATYGGAAGFLASNGTLTQRVDNETVVTGNTFCNTGPVTVPGVGAGKPYPSLVTVSGLTGTVGKITATLKGMSHQSPIDFDVLLSGPTPSTNLFLLSDAGGFNPVSNVDVTVDDDALAGVPSPLVGGTFRPTNPDDGSIDVMPAPAPPASSATTLATFKGASPNGAWNLWVVDDASGDSGAIAGGWCLTVTTIAQTTTALTASVNPSSPGQAVTFTAAVRAGTSPVDQGTVSFSVDGSVVETGVALLAGKATWSTSSLDIGVHTVLARYSGSASYLPSSSDSVDQAVDPVVDAGGPYTTTEGGSVTLDGSGSSPGLVFAWDLNGDGVFGDATGVSPTLTWAELESLGIDDGPATHDVMLRVTDGIAVFDSASTALRVTNTAPTVSVTGDPSVTIDTPLMLHLSVLDPSSQDMSSQFTYVIDWGDGSPVETMTDAAELTVTHTYTGTGLWSISVTVTDKDGGQGDPTSVQARVIPAASPSPSPSGTPSPSVSPTVTPTPSPSVTPTSGQTDLYSTPGYHDVNGRTWFTSCENYSQTVRCRTSIWATQVTYAGGVYRQATGWYFNNMTYLPYMKRSQWADNPLGYTGQWTSQEGRRWRTECDTPATGRNGCRSFIWASYIASKVDSGGNRAYYWRDGWLFNNIVRFR